MEVFPIPKNESGPPGYLKISLKSDAMRLSFINLSFLESSIFTILTAYKSYNLFCLGGFKLSRRSLPILTAYRLSLLVAYAPISLNGFKPCLGT